MTKFTTARQFMKAIWADDRLQVTVGKTGQVSDAIAEKVLDTKCFKATFWGFDDAGNNIVVFKSLT